MHKKHLFLLLLLAFCAPMVANAQSLTVCNGTATNAFIPVYGYSADWYGTTSEFIIPSAGLSAMNGMDISSLTFYLSSPAEDPWEATFKVYMKEVPETTLTGVYGPDDCYIVYTGELNGTGSTMSITFDNNYTYQGGNLLIGTFVSYAGIYASASFYGISTSTASAYVDHAYDEEGPYNFLPKTTFTYQVADPCKTPMLSQNITVGVTTASLSWTEYGTADNWTLQYGTDETFAAGTYSEVSDGFVINGSIVVANLESLTPETRYYARVKPECDTDGTHWSNTVSFKPTATEYITLCDGTETNDFVPFGTNNQEFNNQCEYIIPSDQLLSLAGYYLNTIKLYPDHNLILNSVTVYLRIVDNATFSNTSFYGIEGSTTVYTGSLHLSESEGLVVEFNEPYEYNGGNLLIGFYKPFEYGGSYTAGSFRGITAEGASLSAYSYSNSLSPIQRNFIPTTTFGRLPQPYPTPVIVSAVATSPVEATVTWIIPETGNPTSYAYQYKLSTDDWGDEIQVDDPSQLSVNLNGLIPASTYDFRMVAKYNDIYSSWASTQFTTPDYCMYPENLTITDITHEGATLNWTEQFGYGEWKLGYKTINETAYTYVDVTASQLPYHINGLNDLTTYMVQIYPQCDATKTLESNFTTLQIPTVVDNGWMDDFEGSTNWVLVNGTIVNAWSIGTATNHGGVKSLYISKDGGISNSYNTSKGTMVFATKLFTFDAGKYSFSFDWKAMGESTWDLMRVALVDCNTTFTASSDYNFIHNGLPEGWIAIDGGTKLNLTSDWTTQYSEFEITQGGNYYVVFAWCSDASRGTQPPAAVDNFSVSPLCLTPTAINAINVNNHSATLTWTPAEGQEAWQIAYSNTSFDPNASGFDPTTVSIVNVNNTNSTVIDGKVHYTFDNTLAEETTYYMCVRGNCGGDGNSRWSSMVVFFTHTPETYTLNITGYGDSENNNYYLIASPIGEACPSTVENMLENQYDLYAFNQIYNYEEWRNYKSSNFILEPGSGYLYANSEDITLTFTGIPYSGNGVFTLAKDDNAIFAGWNLMGNPFDVTAYIEKPFYIMNDDGTELTTAVLYDGIEPMHGVFVVADTDGETLTFSTTPIHKAVSKIIMNLIHGRGYVIDRAIVCFDEGNTLEKFQLNSNHTKVYIPMDGKNYAVINAAEMGEMPVSFKAENNGTYTLSFTSEEVSFSYLHLIDNTTGADVDLLQTSNYTFEAKTTDYASRFKLVFICEDTVSDNDDFAFFSNGSFIINNNGEATLQVVDAMGRILKSENINGSTSVNVNAAAGVYMLRLINGDNVKVQKVVVR